MGKTRLVDELAARLMQHGTPVHRGYCETYLGGSALQPFHQIVRSILLPYDHVDPAAGRATLADALERLVPGHGATLTRWFGAAGPEAPPVPFADLAAAIVALVDRDEGPIALCIDDWQWTDDASAGLLEGLLRDVRRPLFLTLAARDDRRLDTLSGAQIIRLPPLDEDEVRHAIGSIFAARDAPAPPPFLVDRIVARAGGCPLFVEELCHSASVPGAARGEADGPSWLAALIQARFAALPPALAERVVVESVIGPVVPRR